MIKRGVGNSYIKCHVVELSNWFSIISIHFSPSAYYIEKVMTNNIQKITKNIELLREIIF